MFHHVAAFLRQQGWTAWSVSQLGSNSLIWCIFRPGDISPSIVGKLPRTPLHTALARKEARALQNLGPFAARLGIPRLLFEVDLPRDGYLFLQSGVPGALLPEQGAFFGRIVPWLLHFQQTPARGTLDDVCYDASAECLGRLDGMTDTEQRLTVCAREMGAELHAIPAFPVHGDFWTGNVLEHRASLSVIDWSNYQYGSPLEDLHNFAAGQGYDARDRAEDSMWSMWRVFFADTPLMQRTRVATLEILKNHGIPTELLRPLFVLFLVRRLGCTEFTNHNAWRRLAAHYLGTGMPEPFTVVR